MGWKQNYNGVLNETIQNSENNLRQQRKGNI